MKKLVILLAAALTFNSCSDSFLDLSNPSALSPSVYPKSMADMETIVTSVYANMVAVPLYGKRVMAKGTFCVDHTVDMAWTGDANWNQLATNQVTSDNAYIGTLWIGYYKMISCANTVLEQLERIDKEKFTDADLARLSQMKGEALFWRGWAHQQLVAFFGEGYPCNGDGDKKGVPVRLQVASTPDMLNIERSTVAEVYDQILKDYEAAKLLLPAVWEERADYPRPTSVAVASYIGQANLYMGNYDAAKKALKEVIDSSGKELLPFNEYAKMFNEDQEKFNRESILEINFSNGDTSGYFWYGEGSQYGLIAALCFQNASGDVEAAGWGNIFFHDANIKRFNGDPRLDIAALRPGTPVIMNGQQTQVLKYKDTEADIQGWSMRKYNPLKSTVNELNLGVGINMYLMRLADVYLMYAEACQATGDEVNARNYMNLVRRRAYNGDSSHDITASGEALRDAIREERFMEFCGEGVQHWQDVCRWKVLDEEISRWYGKTRVGNPHYDAKDLYFPIPKVEMENNPNMTQSIGYENE